MNESQRRATTDRSNTREQLLAATRRCVREHGLAATTSRRITDTAGANLAAITYHFGSKDELIAEALFSDLERRIQPILSTFDAPDADPARGLLEAVERLTEEFERSRADRLLYLETLVLALRDNRYRTHVTRLYSLLHDKLVELIARLVHDDVIPNWIEPDAAASLILAVANGIALQTMLDPRGPGHDAIANQFAAMLLAVASTKAPPQDAQGPGLC